MYMYKDASYTVGNEETELLLHVHHHTAETWNHIITGPPLREQEPRGARTLSTIGLKSLLEPIDLHEVLKNSTLRVAEFRLQIP